MYDLEEAIAERHSVRVCMFVQTLLLALTARGLGTCVQVSIAGYPDVAREQLNIGEDMRILRGLAIGYPDPTFPANHLRVPRNQLASSRPGAHTHRVAQYACPSASAGRY